LFVGDWPTGEFYPAVGRGQILLSIFL